MDSSVVCVPTSDLEPPLPAYFDLSGPHTPPLAASARPAVMGLGAALTPDVHAYRVGLLKGMGANGWRASHGPLDPALLDELDRQGILVRGAGDAAGSVPVR